MTNRLTKTAIEAPAARRWDDQLRQSIARGEPFEKLNIGTRVSSMYSFMPVGLNRGIVPSRPVILRSGFADELHRTALRVVEVIRRLAEHMDTRRLLQLGTDGGFSPEYQKLIGAKWTLDSTSTHFARPDIIIHRGQPKVLELNIDMVLGGLVDSSILPHQYMASEIGCEVRRYHNIQCLNPMAMLRDFIDKAWKSAGRSGSPRVGFIDFIYDELFYTYAHYQAAVLSSMGIPSKFMTPESKLSLKDGYLYADGSRLDIVIRSFPVEQMEFPRDQEFFEPIFEAVQQGKVLWLPQERQTLASDKTLFAHLWENLHLLSAEETALMRQVTPWSAFVRSQSTVEFEAQQVKLDELLHPRHRKRFVIKKGVGHGGESVTIGNHVSEHEWSFVVEKAMSEGGYVVQEFFAPDTIEMPLEIMDEKRIEFVDCEMLLGPYLIDEALGGFLSRLRAVGQTGPINHALGAMCALTLVE